jgi:hypothetical protein
MQVPQLPPAPEDTDSLPYPLNLADEEQFAALRSMSAAERLDLSMRVSALSSARRRRWVANLRAQFPCASDEEFRLIVIGRILEEGEEERRINRRIAARDAARRGERSPP